MKNLIPLLMIIALLSQACEYSELTTVGSINIDQTFNVDQTGPFSQSSTITYNQVLQNMDIPNNAVIDQVNIESISAKVIVLPDNVATAVSLSGKLQFGNSNPEIFNDYPAVLAGADAPLAGLNALIDDGVQGLKTKIEDYVRGRDYSPFNFILNGNSSPIPGMRVHAQILIKIKGSVKYTSCELLPFLMGGDQCGGI